MYGLSVLNAKFRYIELCRSLRTYGVSFFAVKVCLCVCVCVCVCVCARIVCSLTEKAGYGNSLKEIAVLAKRKRSGYSFRSVHD